jgi:ABC-type amino acid transport system permease subunit
VSTEPLISVLLGLLIALPGLSLKRGFRGINRTYVELIRAVPILGWNTLFLILIVSAGVRWLENRMQTDARH